jgi:hypothetical protein
VQFDASRSRKNPLSVLSSSHARLLEKTVGPVVVKRILAVGIRSVDGNAFETLDPGS